MKHLLILFLAFAVLKPSISLAEKSKCMWRYKNGSPIPAIFYCGEKKVKYYFGDLDCLNAQYKNIFCRADISSNGTKCYNDRLNKENIECREKKDKELAKVKSPIRMNQSTMSIMAPVKGSK